MKRRGSLRGEYGQPYVPSGHLWLVRPKDKSAD